MVEALAAGPLATDELRDAAGGAVTNLGEEGRRKGLTSTLPLALGRRTRVGHDPPKGVWYAARVWNDEPVHAPKLERAG